MGRMAEKRVEKPAPTWMDRLRRAVLFVLFGLVLLIPKLVGLRRRRRAWNALRWLAGLAGLLLAAAFVRGLVSWPLAAAGALLLALALLVPPSRAVKTVDQQARELGALVVLNAGRCCQAGRAPVRANLYVAAACWYVLDLQHRPLVEIPRESVTAIRADREADGWTLRVRWDAAEAEFRYDGFFAEHLARVAETTLCGQWQLSLPVLQ